MNKKDAQKLLNKFVAAQKIMSCRCGDIYAIGSYRDVQVSNLRKWCELLDESYIREDWEGNDICNSNFDIIYFIHENIKFFELVDKEKNDDGQ